MAPYARRLKRRVWRGPAACRPALRAPPQSLDEANKNPEFTLYLIYILVHGGTAGIAMELREVGAHCGSCVCVGTHPLPQSLPPNHAAALLSSHLQLAGLVARGNIEHVYKSCGEAVVVGMRSMALQGLADAVPIIRKGSNNIVATLARQLHALDTWRDLFPSLVALAKSGNDA